jgi:hypothetical protein
MCRVDKFPVFPAANAVAVALVVVIETKTGHGPVRIVDRVLYERPVELKEPHFSLRCLPPQNAPKKTGPFETSEHRTFADPVELPDGQTISTSR